MLSRKSNLKRNNNNNSKRNNSNRNNSNRNNSNNSKKKSIKNSKQPSFAAKLGAFILEAVSSKEKIVWSKDKGFTAKHPQIFGVLPFLHLNITEKQLRSMLNKSHKSHLNSLSNLCSGQKLNTVLNKVNFNCKNQSNKGILSLENSVIDSINNRWNMRANGRQHLAVLEKCMRKQVELKIIPAKSIDWAK